MFKFECNIVTLVNISILPALLAGPVRADGLTYGPASAPASVSASTSDALLGIESANPQHGLPVGGFLVYPSVFVGGIYNNNVYSTENNQLDGFGIEVTPNITAIDDLGIHKTTLTLNADATAYPGVSRPRYLNAPSANNITGTVTFDHLWKPTEDVSVDMTGGFTRQNGVFGTFGAAGSAFISSANASSAAASNQNWNQVSGALSVEKLLTDRWFVRGGLGAQDIEYESLKLGGESQSGFDYNAFLRSGYWVAPQFNAFVEIGGDWWRYRDGWYNTNAYRVIGGVSSDLISLFRGEIYAGVQQQVSTKNVFGSVTKPTFGGKISYYPTRYLTLAASLDQSFGSAATPSTTTVNSSPSGDTLQARFQVNYNWAEYWSITARAGLARTTWSNSPLEETAWTAGGTLNYNYWRNLALTLNYQYIATGANRSYINIYAQNIFSAGLTYHY